LIETTEKQHWQPSYKQIVTHLFAIQREEDYSKKAKEKSFKVLRALLRASPENFEQMLTWILDELFITACFDKDVRNCSSFNSSIVASLLR